MAIVRHKLTPPEYVPGTYWIIGDEFGNVVLSRGIFAFDYFYYLFFEWMIEHGWASRLEFNFRERLFLQRDTSHGSELWVYWRMKKKSPDPLFFFELDLNIHVVGLQPTEVVVKDKKIKANKGEAEVKYWIRMVMDQKFANSWVYKNFGGLLLKRLYAKRYEATRREILREAERFREAVKTYFDIETYKEEPELKKFFSIRGVE